jgi:xanthine dehydrogenase accessory factor
MGSVSGGCIEGAVITEACEAIAEGKPRILDFGVSDAQAWDVGLACGGAIRIHVEPLAADRFDRLQAFRHRRAPVALVMDLASGRQTLFAPEDGQSAVPVPEEQRRKIAAMLHQSSSGLLEFEPSQQLFVRSYASAWSLILVGAVHIAQFLAPMARLAGFDVTLIDPRRAFATALRFPNLQVVVGWPDDVMAEMSLRRQTAVVTLAHDPKIDDPALFAALKSPAFYVGALGSRRTHAQRVERLSAGGVSPTDIARIAAPVGLDLGGRSPAEIAVAVLAEVVGARYGRQRVSP